MLLQTRVQFSRLQTVEHVGATPFEFTADKDLRQAWRPGAALEHLAHLAAAIALLVSGRIEIYRGVSNAMLCKHLSR